MTSIRGDSISMIFQEASTSLNPVLSVGFQVGESFHFHRRVQMLEDTIRDLDGEIERRGFFLARGWKRCPGPCSPGAGCSRTTRRRSTASTRLYQLEGRAPGGPAAQGPLIGARDRLGEKSVLAEFCKRVPFLRRYYRRLERTVAARGELLRSLGVANPERIAEGYPHELSGACSSAS